MIVVITFLMIYMKKDLNSFLPTLALFAVAAFRILPITNRLIISIQHMKKFPIKIIGGGIPKFQMMVVY